MKAIKWLFQKHAPLAIRLDGSLFQLKWMAAMLANCSARRYAVNKERMRACPSTAAIACANCARPPASIMKSARAARCNCSAPRRSWRRPAATSPCWKRSACPYELLDRNRLATAEPALERSSHKLSGGLRLPNDETGDCHLFTTRLAAMAAELGVEFRYGQNVAGLNTAGGQITGVRVGDEVLTADRYVAAFGSYTRGFLEPLGLDLPVYPLKGYSLTVPMVDESAAPVSTILDETYKIAVTRFDQRIRVGGMAEVAGFDLRLKDARRKTLEMVVDDLFPAAATCRAPNFDRPAADDARWHAGGGRHPLRQPVPEHRPRHAGLDHGLRFGQAGGGSGHGPASGHPRRRPGPVALRPGRRAQPAAGAGRQGRLSPTTLSPAPARSRRLYTARPAHDTGRAVVYPASPMTPCRVTWRSTRRGDARLLWVTAESLSRAVRARARL